VKKDVDMLIILGDAPPNTQAEIKQKKKDPEWTKY